MTFPYKCVLVIGATSGIGLAMATRLVREGSKVIAVGRRQDRLDGFVHKHGQGKAQAMRFDIGEMQKIPQFVADATSTYPDIDCVFLNAGIQGRYDLTQPEKINMTEFHREMDVNYSSFVMLTLGFLPFLKKKQSPTSLIYTGSNLAIVPASILPAYSASKAALNAFVLCLRDQLRDTSIKVIEISPPPVQTELHDVQMGEEAGRALGMPVDQFTDEAFKGLESGSDQIVIGSIGPAETFNEIIDKRRAAFTSLANMMRAHAAK